MNKLEFLEKLRLKLSVLPQKDVEERLYFYNEIIDDKMEEGFSEEQAVESVGPIDKIFLDTVSDIPFSKLAKEKVKRNRRLKTWELILLIVGSPIWLSLLISVFAVIFSLYVSVWGIIVSLWASFASLVACSVCGVLYGVVLGFISNKTICFATIGASFVLAGIAVLFFFGCKIVTESVILLTKKIMICIKKQFVKKENVNE